MEDILSIMGTLCMEEEWYKDNIWDHTKPPIRRASDCTIRVTRRRKPDSKFVWFGGLAILLLLRQNSG